VRTKANNEKEDLYKKEIDRLTLALTTLNNPKVTEEQINDIVLTNFQTVNIQKQSKKLKDKM
jgi:hypothetical protein